MKRSILIVEDESLVAISIKKKLLKADFEVAGIAISGEEALEMLKNITPDLILMDIKLQGRMDGIDTAEKIRDIYEIPVIYLTAFSNLEILERVKSTEPFGYIIKPYNERELLSNIEIALYKHGLEARLKASEERFRLIAETSRDIIFQVNDEFIITYISPAVRDVLGYEPGEIMRRPFDEVFSDAGEYGADPRGILAGAGTGLTSVKVRARNGEWRFLESSFSALREKGSVLGIQGIARDVTERVMLDLRQKLTLSILELLNSVRDTDEIVRGIVGLIKDHTGFAAVALRIKEGNAFPLYDQRGYTERHLASAACMSPLDENGAVKCFCGVVLKDWGKGDPKHFTPGGSFHSNHFSDFVKEQGEAVSWAWLCDLYESVGIIPLTFEGSVIGLLHVADPRPGLLPLKEVLFFEGIGASIGVALERKKARDGLRRSLEEKERLLRKEKRILAKERELQREIMSAIQAERQRIGRDLHDGLGQNLTAVAFLSEALSRKLRDQNGSLVADAEEINKMISSAIVQTKMIAKMLSPVPVGPEGLMNAIEGIASSVSKLYNVQCRVKLKGGIPVMDGGASENLFYITAEAVHNAVKHGSPTAIEIAMEGDDSSLSIRVSDDGVGMGDAATRQNGLGLKIMKYRAMMIDAEFEAVNNDEGGASIYVQYRRGT